MSRQSEQREQPPIFKSMGGGSKTPKSTDPCLCLDAHFEKLGKGGETALKAKNRKITKNRVSRVIYRHNLQ